MKRSFCIGAALLAVSAFADQDPRPLPLDLTPDVRDIVLACLSKDREERPASSRDLVDRLRAARNAYVARHDSIDQRLAAIDQKKVENPNLVMRIGEI